MHSKIRVTTLISDHILILPRLSHFESLYCLLIKNILFFYRAFLNIEICVDFVLSIEFGYTSIISVDLVLIATGVVWLKIVICVLKNHVHKVVLEEIF